MTDQWTANLGAQWADALAPAHTDLAAAAAFLDAEARAGRTWLPERARVMRAFQVPLDAVRVVIVGQDPYPTPGDAVGLSFSVAPGHPMPRSLRNIATELMQDTGETLSDGDLSHWARQGVMLLNRVLTVSAGEAGSHRGRGWEEVTAQALRTLGARGGPLVAVLWGKDAQAAGALLGDVPVVTSAHPSPLSARRGFFGSRPFSQVNALLEKQGANPIRWGQHSSGTANASTGVSTPTSTG
ncbi:uracil-DNA glycosylase [Demequina globuliformis]|uniref:uracil-DNA glycosylase n=1 Tax=Demequina globuliformis TaxID=676202 RepID=UPI0009FBDB94|nr:uracil-DNA glycosylase [Demequina globuliformis]